jgi:tetratricopeptide (TPR) repeat protein
LVTARTRRRRPAPVSESLGRLGDRLRQARVEAGLSQAQLGSPHFTRAYVSAIELGKARPAMKSLEFMAAKLGRPVKYFLEDEEEERRRRERELAITRASQLVTEGKGGEAIELLEPLLERSPGMPERLELMRLLGRGYLEKGMPGRAAAVFSEALRGYELLRDEEKVARTRGQLGAALLGTLSLQEAESHLGAALQATAMGLVKDPVFRVHLLHNLGVGFYLRGDHATALEYFERAEREGADIGDPKWLGSLYTAIAMSRHRAGDHEAAITYLRRSEALFKSIRNRMRLAEIRFHMARVLRHLGNASRAKVLADHAHGAAAEAGNRELALRALVLGSLCLADLGRRREAIERVTQAVTEADETGERVVRFIARVGLANLVTPEDEGGAETLYRAAVSLFEPGSEPREVADAYRELSQLLARRGLAEEALEYSRKAYQVATRA